MNKNKNDYSFSPLNYLSWANFAGYFVPVLNILLFFWWLGIVGIWFFTPPSEEFVYFLDVIQVQLILIEITVVFVAIVLTVLGFYGYNMVLQRAENRAIEVAKGAINNLVAEAVNDKLALTFGASPVQDAELDLGEGDEING